MAFPTWNELIREIVAEVAGNAIWEILQLLPPLAILIDVLRRARAGGRHALGALSALAGRYAVYIVVNLLTAAIALVLHAAGVLAQSRAGSADVSIGVLVGCLGGYGMLSAAIGRASVEIIDLQTASQQAYQAEPHQRDLRILGISLMGKGALVLMGLAVGLYERAAGILTVETPLAVTLGVLWVFDVLALAAILFVE